MHQQGAMARTIPVWAGLAALMSVAAPAVRAETVEFRVLSGIFASTGTAVIGGTNGQSSWEISFSHAADSFENDLSLGMPWSPVIFGHFTASAGGNANFNIDEAFTLTIAQSTPGNTSGDAAATVVGQLKNDAGGRAVIFSFLPFQLPAAPLAGAAYVTYAFDSFSLSAGQTQNLNGTVTLQENIAQAPAVSLPGVAGSGMVLLTGLAIAKLLRARTQGE